jgi:hypothetical protein
MQVAPDQAALIRQAAVAVRARLEARRQKTALVGQVGRHQSREPL